MNRRIRNAALAVGALVALSACGGTDPNAEACLDAEAAVNMAQADCELADVDFECEEQTAKGLDCIDYYNTIADTAKCTDEGEVEYTSLTCAR